MFKIKLWIWQSVFRRIHLKSCKILGIPTSFLSLQALENQLNHINQALLSICICLTLIYVSLLPPKIHFHPFWYQFKFCHTTCKPLIHFSTIRGTAIVYSKMKTLTHCSSGSYLATSTEFLCFPTFEKLDVRSGSCHCCVHSPSCWSHEVIQILIYTHNSLMSYSIWNPPPTSNLRVRTESFFDHCVMLWSWQSFWDGHAWWVSYCTSEFDGIIQRDLQKLLSLHVYRKITSVHTWFKSKWERQHRLKAELGDFLILLKK